MESMISKNLPLKVEDFDDNPWDVQDVSGKNGCGILCSRMQNV